MKRSERFDAWAKGWLARWLRPTAGPSLAVGIAAIVVSPVASARWGLSTWQAGLVVAAVPFVLATALALVYGWLRSGEESGS